jgi:hypothetical protein
VYSFGVFFLDIISGIQDIDEKLVEKRKMSFDRQGITFIIQNIP